MSEGPHSLHPSVSNIENNHKSGTNTLSISGPSTQGRTQFSRNVGSKLNLLHSNHLNGGDYNNKNTTDFLLNKIHVELTEEAEDDPNFTPPYRHQIRVVPPYVLERLSKNNANPEIDKIEDNLTKRKPNARNQVFTANEIVHEGTITDPFVKSFKDDSEVNKWADFLNTIKMPNTTIPANNESNKILMNELNNYESNESLRIKNNLDECDIQSYYPPNKYDEKRLINDIFDSYNLDGNWKGDLRLKDLFENTSDSRCSDNEDLSGDENPDLEKGNRHQFRRHFHKDLIRDKALKQKARHWIEENKKNWKPKLLGSIMTNSYIPLFFRLISLTLSSIALGLSARLVFLTESFNVSQQASPLMAIIVQSVSIAYLLYVTYDEFTSQPLGLRDPKAKIRLILLDLLFIIFSSANLSLSFQSMYDTRWVCKIDKEQPQQLISSPSMCVRQKTLTAFLFLTLVVWCITFTISVFRIVHVVSYNREKNNQW